MGRRAKTEVMKKPVYEGERKERCSMTRIVCEQPGCKTLAHYRARRYLDGAPYDEFMCEEHLRQAIRLGEATKAAELPEYRKYLHRMARWRAVQNAGEQGGLF